MDQTLNDSWSNADVEKKDKWVTKTNQTKVVIAYSWKKSDWTIQEVLPNIFDIFLKKEFLTDLWDTVKTHTQ